MLGNSKYNMILAQYSDTETTIIENTVIKSCLHDLSPYNLVKYLFISLWRRIILPSDFVRFLFNFKL